MRELTFESEAFDLVLDKGTLDCVWLGGGGGVERMLDEVERVLKRGGAFMCFSLYGYEERMELMEQGGWEEEVEGKERRRRLRDWQVTYHVLDGPLEVPQQPHTFLYTAFKT